MKTANKIKNILLGVLAVATMSSAAIMPALAATCPDGKDKPTIEECLEGEEKEGEEKEGIKAKADLMSTVKKIVDFIIGLIGVVAVFMVIFGGFQYTTSQGDPGKVKKAKDTILYGIVGLVVALLAFGIVNFVLKNLF